MSIQTVYPLYPRGVGMHAFRLMCTWTILLIGGRVWHDPDCRSRVDEEHKAAIADGDRPVVVIHIVIAVSKQSVVFTTADRVDSHAAHRPSCQPRPNAGVVKWNV